MQKQRYALVKKEYRIPFILVTSLFFLWGFAHAILDVLNKHFQDVMVISRAHSAWVQVMFYLGYFVMAIPAGLFINNTVIAVVLSSDYCFTGSVLYYLFPENIGCRSISFCFLCSSSPVVWFFWRLLPIPI